MLVGTLAGERPVSGTCPVATVVISGGGARFAEAALYESGRSLRPSLAVNAQIAGPRREPRMTRQANMNGRSERIPRTGSWTTTTVRFCRTQPRGAAVQPLSLSRPWEEFPVVARPRECRWNDSRFLLRI
jgi:hypothetical protein